MVVRSVQRDDDHDIGSVLVKLLAGLQVFHAHWLQHSGRSGRREHR
jgi:hypothetical protein